MDGIRSSFGGCLLSGNPAHEFYRGERRARWSPGETKRQGQQLGCRGPSGPREDGSGYGDRIPGRSANWVTPGTKSERCERGKLLFYAGIPSLQWCFQLPLCRREGGVGGGLRGVLRCLWWDRRGRLTQLQPRLRLPLVSLCTTSGLGLGLELVRGRVGLSCDPTLLRGTRGLQKSPMLAPIPTSAIWKSKLRSINCLSSLGVHELAQKHIQRLLRLTLGSVNWNPSEWFVVARMLSQDFSRRSPGFRIPGRSWEHVGESLGPGGCLEQSGWARGWASRVYSTPVEWRRIVSQCVGQKLLQVSLKVLETSPTLDPTGPRPLGRQLKQKLVI